MTNRMVKLDEMAEALAVNRRTAERLRDVIALNFDVVEESDGRRKRFRIQRSLRRVYTRPTAAEIAALQGEVAARVQENAPQAALLAKVKAALDSREKRKLDPDLEALTRLQRSRVSAGPVVMAEPEALTAVQGAILAANCVEFDYLSEGSHEPKWRRLIPYGLIHGTITYLVGKLPARDDPPITYRLDQMGDVRIANVPGCPPDSWDLDAWMAQSFGIWREDDHDIVLRIREPAVARAQAWRFHPGQALEAAGNELLVRFRAGGLREIADHLFTWGGDVVIEGPEALRNMMCERLAAARLSVDTSTNVVPAVE